MNVLPTGRSNPRVPVNYERPTNTQSLKRWRCGRLGHIQAHCREVRPNNTPGNSWDISV